MKDSSPSLSTLASRLRQVGHFRNFAEQDLETIVSAGQVLPFPAGSIIFSEDEPCAGMFVLLSGQVHLRKLGPQGQQSMIGAIHPVIMFNEVSALDGGTNMATAQAIEDCVTWSIGYANFQRILQRYPQIGLGLLQVLAARTRLLLSKYEDLSFRSVLARTAKLLLDLSESGQHPIDRRKHPNSVMAATISTVPEALSRSLQVFKKSGDIACTRSSIIVRYPETLAKFAHVIPTSQKREVQLQKF